MRIWDISPKRLCRQHLLAEHHELHVIWAVLTKNKKGYSRHPETMRWRGKLKALYLRHEKLTKEMKTRGYAHRSFLDVRLARGKARQDKYINSLAGQITILRLKKCRCKV